MTVSVSELETEVLAALDELKAVNVRVFDVRALTSIMDCMIIASGTSDRHVNALAEQVIERAKANGVRPLGVEGQREGEWVLVDLGDLVVHLMLPRTRDFYALEKLWSADEAEPRVARD